jgi:hypothetical protein
MTDNVYVTGTGQKIVNVHHENSECEKFGCVIHHPTDPHQDWPTHWRSDRGIMERICPCGVGHPDADHMSYVRRTCGAEFAMWEGLHGCCADHVCGRAR